jgi:putative flippase GtrA
MNESQQRINDKLRFVLVGLLNTLIAFALFTALVLFSRPGFQVLYVIILSSSLSYVSGFFLYKKFVWRESAASIYEFIKFVKSNLVFLTLNLMSLYLFVNRLNFDPIAVQLFTTGILVVVSFLIHDRWTFSQKFDDPESTSITKVESEY